LTYEGGGTDFLGFDDGTRAIPTRKNSNIPLYANVVGRPESAKGQQFRSILEKFNPNLAAIREKSAMDFGLGFNLGNQVAIKNNTIGYNFSLVYKNETEYYKGAQYARYGKGRSPEKNELEVR